MPGNGSSDAHLGQLLSWSVSPGCRTKGVEAERPDGAERQLADDLGPLVLGHVFRLPVEQDGIQRHAVGDVDVHQAR